MDDIPVLGIPRGCVWSARSGAVHALSWHPRGYLVFAWATASLVSHRKRSVWRCLLTIGQAGRS